jgi:7tm Chemosensory receptor
VGIIRDATQIEFIIIMVITLVHSVIILLLQITYFTKIENEIEEMRDNLHGNLLKHDDAKARRRIRLTLMQIDHSDIKFSSGLFIFDWKLIYSVIAGDFRIF